MTEHSGLPAAAWVYYEMARFLDILTPSLCAVMLKSAVPRRLDYALQVIDDWRARFPQQLAREPYDAACLAAARGLLPWEKALELLEEVRRGVYP